MAVAYDANSTANGTTSISWTHTPVGAPAGAYVFVSHCGTTPTNGTNSNDVTGVTYGGFPMTLVQSRTGGGTNLRGMVACYFLGSAVPSGAQTIVVTGGATSKYCFAKTVTAATRNTKVQNSSTIAETSYTKNTTVNAGTIAKSSVSCLQDTVVLNSQTAVGRSSPLTSPAYSVDGTHERDWGTALTGVYRLTAVNTTDTQTGFIGTTDTGTGYYILVGICVAEESGLAHRQTDTALASDTLGLTLGTPVGAISVTQSDTARASDSVAGSGGTVITGISLDAGFPVTGSAQTTSGTASWNSSTFTTGGAVRTIVVTAAVVSYDFAPTTLTITWNGGTPANASAFATQSESPNSTDAWNKVVIATATTTGVLTDVSITITRNYNEGTATNDAYAYSVYSLANAGVVGDTSQHYTTNSPTNNYETLTGVVAGSWLFVGAGLQATTVTDQSNTTKDVGPQANAVPDNIAVIGHNYTGTSGDIVVGWTGTTSYSAVAAVEIKAGSVAEPTGTFSDTARASDQLAGMVNPVFGEITTDTARANDTLGIALVKNVAQTDTGLASDSVAAGVTKNVLQTDNAQATDQLGLALTKNVDQTDSAVASDVFDLTLAVAAGAFSHTQQDNAQASDSEEAQKYIPSLVQTDNAQASDSEAAQKYLPSLLQTDNAQASDSVASGVARNVLQTDTARASDSVEATVLRNVAQTDTARASDSLDISVLRNVAQTDTALAGDQFNVILASAGVVAADQSDSAVASDTVGLALVKNTAQTDTAYASDTLAFAIGIAASFSDSVLAGDDAALALVKNVAQSDSAVALDSWDVALGTTPGAYSATQSDSALASDSLEAVGGTVINNNFNSNVYIWSGAAWVRWNGSMWV